MTLRALRTRDAWSFLDHVGDISLSPPCFGELLMECEQRGWMQHMVALLKRLGDFGVATSYAAAMCVAAQSEVKLSHSQVDTAPFLCIWCAGGGQVGGEASGAGLRGISSAHRRQASTKFKPRLLPIVDV
eukprot:gnl/TRDRNA2_/TRDRNA2_74526_c0_seq1.p2 gnl/TRDRNA2_/TRDRNA2_74526_c0~~gnl/TRDRNA2_/TRDRNA2_74526_c0_seq1.p2  ORF type:complete len:130 (+),score=16.62 gnl/TRDRNA2_/TRDRNA2_74526_c0_seq1:659-1048(+)